MISHHCDDCGGPVEDDGSRDCGHLQADVISVATQVAPTPDRSLTIRGSWYRHGTDWVVVIIGQPQDAVQIGIGATVAKAWDSLEDTSIRSTGGETAALRWAASRGWIDHVACSVCDGSGDDMDCSACNGEGCALDLEPADDAAAASVTGPIGDVSWSDDTHSYVACVYGDDGAQPGDCYTRHGEDELGLWWTDDGDDSVRQDVTGPYDTEDTARDAAEELAEDQDEGAGDDAETVRHDRLTARAGKPNPSGKWCVYWHTVLDDAHVVDRYTTRDAAEAAAQLADDGLRASNPGSGLQCGYEVRHLEGGKWVEVR